jgi:hypothetical protein
MTRHFFVRTFAIAPQDLYKPRLDELQFCSCSYSSILASDQRELGAGRPAGRSADSVRQPSASNPLFIRDGACFWSVESGRKEV